MNAQQRKLALGTTLILALAGSVAFGQTPDAQNKLLAKRAAEADAYRKLAEAVYGVQISSDTYVRDFVTESDEIRAGVDAYVRGARFGKATWYEDLSCEIEAEVTVAKLVTTLKEMHATHYRGNTVTTTDFEQIKQHVQKDIISVIGMGAPRPDLPPELPAGVAEIITPLPAGVTPPQLFIPDLWKSVPPQARLMALQAARRDAQRKLLERIKGLRLTSDTLVRDFVTESDEIRTSAQGLVVGAVETERYLHTDELIAEVTMEVPVARVLTMLQQFHSEHRTNTKITTTDWSKVKQSIQREVFSATGCGVPKEQFVQQAAAVVGVESPGWFTEVITVEGNAAMTDESPQARLMAIRGAEADAYRKLLEHINGLQINSSTYVRDFVTEHDEISTQVNGLISGAVFSDPVVDSGTVTVRATLQGAEVWRVIHSYMEVYQRRG